jgi:hypothetical protein
VLFRSSIESDISTPNADKGDIIIIIVQVPFDIYATGFLTTAAMNSDCYGSSLENVYLFVEDQYVRCSFSCDRREKSFAFASGDLLHSTASLPCDPIVFLLTMAN